MGNVLGLNFGQQFSVLIAEKRCLLCCNKHCTGCAASVIFVNQLWYSMPNQLHRVLILAGGESEEKSISQSGGRAVFQAVECLPDWEAKLVDPAVQRWRHIDCDIVFPVLHGSDGEDGCLQKQLEQTERPFVGSTSTACELTFDKAKCSSFLKQRSVRCPVECSVSGDSSEAEEQWRQCFAELRARVPDVRQWVVKPNQQGSSVGISVVDERASDFGNQLFAAIRTALSFDDSCLIQQYVEGREITVALLDGEVLTPIEICLPSGFYDFHAKYESEQTKYQIVRDEEATKCGELAQQINTLCGTAGLVRIDFRVDLKGQPWFLEVNTIPGMTERSLVPKSAADRGWTMSDLCQKALGNAMASFSSCSK
ncbi:MAG: ATP-grasp domain-containing protein [Fuerstiella sp.]